MTREELVQMREYKVGAASTEYWNKNKDNDEVSIMTAFEDGVAWADEHPKNPWISVEDMLPEEHSRVLIMFCNGTVTYNDYIGVGDINYMKAHPEIITHWMPIPKIEKGGEK